MSLLACNHPIKITLLALFAGASIASTLPFKFTHFGNFMHMSHTGETDGKVKLSQVPNAIGTWGVGALAGLKGEIVVVDGKVLVSRGTDPQGSLETAKTDDKAVLFASATTTAWTEIPVARDMNQAALESFVVEQAKARGIDPELPFAFLVDGTYSSLRWHVVTGEKPTGSSSDGHGGGHGSSNTKQNSGLRVFHNPGNTGRLVGVYSGKSLEGVVSHPGERFHLHYVDREVKVSGHVDAYAVQAGAILRLPVVK